MPTSPGSDRLPRAFAIVRGAMLVLFAVSFVVAPEQAMPGSSSEPARSLVLVVASRTMLLGLALVVLAIKRKRAALAWVLLADGALQLFDTGLALATGKGVLAVLPGVLCALDVWAGVVLLRMSSPYRPHAQPAPAPAPARELD